MSLLAKMNRVSVGIQAQCEGELHQKDILIQQKDTQLNEIQQQVICLQVRQLYSHKNGT